MKLAPCLFWLLLLLVAAPLRAIASELADSEVVEAPLILPPLPLSTAGGLGHTLGDSGVTVGGYGLAEASDYRGTDAAAALRRLSLMLWWDSGSRLSLFGELEAENLARINSSDEDDNDIEVVLERLHLDYAWSDAVQLRIGKFLTPVGRWNVIHAAPLTWTSSRPLITVDTFPTNATGAMLRGVLALAGKPLEWAVYASPGEELAPADDSDPFQEAYGLRLNYAFGFDFQLGFSLVDFRREHDASANKKTLYGIDLLWQHRGYEISGEWAFRTRRRDAEDADEHGGYLQAVLPLHAPLYGVLRYETFDTAGPVAGLNLYIGGLAWRFRPGWVGKLEYRHATDNGTREPEGWLGSLAVMF